MKNTEIKKGTIMVHDSDENYKVVFVGLNKKVKNHFKGVVLSGGENNHKVGSYYNLYRCDSFKPQ